MAIVRGMAEPRDGFDVRDRGAAGQSGGGGYEGVKGTRPYAGTAEYYARYRPRVSDALLAQLRETLAWGPSSRVLDLGTGPGHLALRIAPLVGEVVGVDPEPDMLAVATEIAREASLTNVRFVEGSSDNLTSLRLGEFQSVTMSASFHWMLDKDRVMTDLAGMTDPDHGSVAFVTTGEIVAPSADFSAAAAVVQSLLDRHLAEVPEGPHPRARHDPFEDILARSAFADVREIEVTYEADTDLTTDALLGSSYSISHVVARLGPRRGQLEAETREALGDLDPPPTTRVTYRDSALIGLRTRT